MSRAEYSCTGLEQIAQLGELREAALGLDRLAGTRGPVEIGPTTCAQPRAVLPAEHLLGELERDRVAGPRREVEPIVLDVRRAQLLGSGRTRGLVLPRRDRERDVGGLEAANARAFEPGVEPEPELTLLIVSSTRGLSGTGR
jgi:hypothetical protein